MNHQTFMDSKLGAMIRMHRLRASLTQVQLARSIQRSGKFLSEVESGKARITQRDLERIADALGVRCDALLNTDAPGDNDWDLPRRIRDVQPNGMTIISFVQLLNHLERSGWLRFAKLWMVSSEPFPEENDLALVEQLASLVTTKDVSLRYVYSTERLTDDERAALDPVQGTVEALPNSLLRALRWSSALRPRLDPMSDRVIGYGITPPMPAICETHDIMWVETQDVSWSDVMPLLYCRGITRTFENPNEVAAFWYHLPRESGSALLLKLAQRLKGFRPRKRDETPCTTD